MEFTFLADLRIPRCIFPPGQASIFLAGFSDGSQVGYAACIYLVIRYPMKESVILVLDQAAEQNPIYGEFFLRHSNFGKLQRVVAYLLRFGHNTVLTIEEFTTLLTRIEAVLNSRPLGFFPSDPNEGTDYLSPGHFLVGGPLISVPEEPQDLKSHPRTRWILIQQMAQYFWKRFHHEYLHYWKTRKKWVKKSENHKVGQIVYVTGEKSSPLFWPLVKIVATYPGADGEVRVVDVKVGGVVLHRAVHKLIIAPVNSEF